MTERLTAAALAEIRERWEAATRTCVVCEGSGRYQNTDRKCWNCEGYGRIERLDNSEEFTDDIPRLLSSLAAERTARKQAEGERDRLLDVLEMDGDAAREYLFNLPTLPGVKDAVEDMMAAVKHCDETPDESGSCCCAQRMAEVVGVIVTERDTALASLATVTAHVEKLQAIIDDHAAELVRAMPPRSV